MMGLTDISPIEAMYSLHAGYLFMLLLSFLYEILSGTLSECQTVWIQIRTDILSVLIWVQTVAKVISR